MSLPALPEQGASPERLAALAVNFKSLVITWLQQAMINQVPDALLNPFAELRFEGCPSQVLQ